MASLRFPASLLVLVTGLLLCTCSKSDNTSTGPDELAPSILTINPSQGIPGSVLDVSGLAINSDSSQGYSAFIAGEPAPFRVIADSSLQVAIPYFIDTISNWSEPPADDAYLEIWKDDQLVGRSSTKISILELPRASGTSEQIRQILDTLVTDLQLFFASLPTTHSWEQEYRDSLMSVMRLLISGPDISLAAILDGSSSLLNGKEADPELADAIMASSGMLAYWQEYGAAFASASGSLRKDISAMQSAGLLCPTFDEDTDLACRMQLYVLVRDWAQEFLSETRQDWESSVGWLFDAVSLYPPAKIFPPVVLGKVIGAILQITDIVVNNAILSLLPSHIANFDMTLETTQMEVDEHTNSQIFLTAANSPAQLTIEEVTTLVFAWSDLESPQYSADIRVIIADIIQYIAEQLISLYAYMYTLAPDFFADPQLTNSNLLAFPHMTWGPVEITNYDLVELFSFDPEVLEPDTVRFEWLGAGCGEASIQARTRAAGERSKLVRDYLFCFICEYTGGAFGEDIAHTPSQQVTVGQPGSMDIVINGLPEGEEADVLVIFPDGTTFEHFRETGSLPDLESGNYEIQANEVELADGTVYVSDPQSQIAEITCDSTYTVEINYTTKFGNIYLVVTGLFEGEEGELPADIVVEGPDGYVLELNRSALIDSLLPGVYDVLAFEVDDNWGQTYVPDPDVSELIVERSNTTTLIIEYKPKFGYINMQVPFLPSGVKADIDVIGPDQYFHHVTGYEEIDSVLPGEYTVQAYEIVDDDGETIVPIPLTQVVTVVAGESVVAWVDYSGGHELTINVSGLPELAAANIVITGPDNYFSTVTGDTTLKVPVGDPYIISANDIVYDGRIYKSTPTDTSVNMNYNKTVSFKYKTRATLSLFLGGKHLFAGSEDEQAQMLILAYSLSGNEDTTIIVEKYEPQRGVLPEELWIDSSCGFERGRLLLNNTIQYYRVEASTSRSSANVDITFDVKDTSALITFEAHLTAVSPVANSTNRGWSRIEVLFSRMFTIEINNPNESSESVAAMGVAGRVEVMNQSIESRGSLNWTLRFHNCGDDWRYTTFFDETILEDDSLQVFYQSTGGSARGGNSEEIDMSFRLIFTGQGREGQPNADVTIKGTFEIIMNQN